MPSLDKFDERLRLVETALTRVETKLENVPTKTYLMGLTIITLVTILGALLGGYAWLAKALVGPVLQGLSGS